MKKIVKDSIKFKKVEVIACNWYIQWRPNFWLWFDFAHHPEFVDG